MFFIFGKTKIDQDNPTIRRAFNIARFNVTMNNGAGAAGSGIDPIVHVL